MRGLGKTYGVLASKRRLRWEGAGGRHRSSFLPSDSCYKVLQMQSIRVVCQSAAAAASRMCCFDIVLLLLLPLLLLLAMIAVAILLCVIEQTLLSNLQETLDITMVI